MLQLTKQSSESELKQYFASVLELTKSDNKYPINLDDVWPLVYSAKDKAVRELKKNFFEDEDFIISLAQKGEQDWGGHNRTDYYLTTSCLEYFIARKVRPVFEVYRQVFHKAIQQPSLPTTYKDALKQLLLQVEANEHLQVENEQQRIQIEKKDEIINEQSTQLQKAAPKVKYYEDTLQSVNTYTTTQIAKELGYTASMLNGCLNKAKIQYYQSGTWMLYSPYCGWRLHRMRTHTFDRNDGSKGSSTQMVWTERGRFFINQLHRYGFDVKLTLKMIKGEEASNG